MARRLGWLVLLGVALASQPARALLWPSEIERVERGLVAADVESRRDAAGRLGELPRSAAARLVPAALEDDDVEVRLRAAAAGRARSLPGLARHVIGWLTHADLRLRLAAAELLVTDPVPEAVTPLSRALADVEPAVRAAAAAALGASGSGEAVIGLLGRLDDSALEVKLRAIDALTRLGDARAVVPLLSRIGDAEPSVRRAVARALGAIADARAEGALVVALRDADEQVRARSVWALGELGRVSSVPSVVGVLGDERASVRAAAARALGRLGGPEAVTALVHALGSDVLERDLVVSALGRLGAGAAQELETCLRSSEQLERTDGCALALAESGAPGAGAAIREAAERGRASLVVALGALALARDASALPFALEYLTHEDRAVRAAARASASALLDPEHPDGRAVQPIAQALSATARREERLELVRLLGRTGAPRAAEQLEPVARSSDDLGLRVAALESLGRLRLPRAPDALLFGLDHEAAEVRLAAATALRASAPRGIARELLERFWRGEAQDRDALGIALVGAFAATPDAALVARAESVFAESRASERDALIEAIAAIDAPAAGAWLERLALGAGTPAAERAKVAEALAGRQGSRALLERLAADRRPSVRQNAVWSLGQRGTAESGAALRRALADADAGVAANAAAALGRVAARGGLALERELCAALAAPSAPLRANALGALRLAGKRCTDRRERTLLLRDPSALVRRAAAALLRDVQQAPEDARALAECNLGDARASVGLVCAGRPSAVPSGELGLLVYAVPAGETSPLPGAPFALERPDGLVRYGYSDRRGALWELGLPPGPVSLGVPAALER